MHLFDVFLASTQRRCCLSVRLSVLPAVSSQHLLLFFSRAKQCAAIATHRIASHCIASHHLLSPSNASFPPCHCFLLSPLFLVLVLFLFLICVSLACLDHHQQHRHSLISPRHDHTATRPRTAASGSHVTEIAWPSSRPADCPCPSSHRLAPPCIASHCASPRLASPRIISCRAVRGSCCVLFCLVLGIRVVCRVVSAHLLVFWTAFATYFIPTSVFTPSRSNWPSSRLKIEE